jgi:hypothetical protein
MSDPSIQALALLEASPPVRVLDGDSSLPAEIEDGDLRRRISGLEISDDKALFAALAAEFGFPPYFGGNWDALLDSLRDLGPPLPASVRLLVEDAGTMLAQAPRTGALLIETWTIAALWWGAKGVPFQLCLLIGR